MNLDGILWENGPRLVVGRRRSGSFELFRVPLTDGVYDELKVPCEKCVEALRETSPRPYEPFAALETNEQHFVYNSSAADPEPGVVGAVRRVDEFEEITGPEFDQLAFIFYAIVWESKGGGFVGFVKKRDPATGLKRGSFFFQFGNALSKVATPNMSIANDVDFVVADSEVLVLRETSFRTLFSDAHVASATLEGNVETVTNLLSSTMPLSDETLDFLKDVGRRKVSVARRLSVLPQRLELVELDIDALSSYLSEFGYNPELFISEDGKVICNGGNVELFLDFIEGRPYTDHLGNERRRADRYSSMS